MPSLVSQTLISDSLPAPEPILFPNSYGSLPCPRPAAARHQQGLSVESRVAAPEGAGGPPRAPSSEGSAWGQGARPVAPLPPSPTRYPDLIRPLSERSQTPSPSRRSRATSGGVTQIPACRWRLPSPVSRKDSLLFCASALFLWRGRSRDSSRALASAPCISPMESDGGARSRRGRQENTDVSLKEPP